MSDRRLDAIRGSQPDGVEGSVTQGERGRNMGRDLAGEFSTKKLTSPGIMGKATAVQRLLPPRQVRLSTLHPEP